MEGFRRYNRNKRNGNKGATIKKRIVARFWKRAARQKKRLFIGAVVVLSLSMAYSFNDSSKIDPAAYIPLLDTIAKGESGGNYNAYYGDPANTAIRFTDMTVGEVQEWQQHHVSQGNVSSAVGKYQIIGPTFEGLVNELGIDKNEKFDEKLQDRMAIALLERRGSIAYASNKISREQFAENIAKEWAALPKTTGENPHASYYAGDGINKSNIAVDEVFEALDNLQGSIKKQ